MSNSMAIAYRMAKRNKKAYGGNVNNEIAGSPGESLAGSHVRSAKSSRDEGEKALHTNMAKSYRKEQLETSRRDKGDRKFLAEGGEVDEKASGFVDHDEATPKYCEHCGNEDNRALNEHGAIEEGPQEGGGFHEESYEGNAGSTGHQSTDHESEMVGRIMKQQQEFSEGGKVANQDENTTDEMPNEFDDLHLRDDLSFSGTGVEGDAKGDAKLDRETSEMIKRIMASRAKKDRLPRPA